MAIPWRYDCQSPILIPRKPPLTGSWDIIKSIIPRQLLHNMTQLLHWCLSCSYNYLKCYRTVQFREVSWILKATRLYFKSSYPFEIWQGPLKFPSDCVRLNTNFDILRDLTKRRVLVQEPTLTYWCRTVWANFSEIWLGIQLQSFKTIIWIMQDDVPSLLIATLRRGNRNLSLSQ